MAPSLDLDSEKSRSSTMVHSRQSPVGPLKYQSAGAPSALRVIERADELCQRDDSQ